MALYGADGRRWAMTERGAGRVARDARSLAIGPSRLHWDGTTLTITIDERTAPLHSRVRGTVRVTPAALHDEAYDLDAGGRHQWLPIAPCAHVEVDLSEPRSRWSGPGYLDSNRGGAALEHDFRRWHWSRARTADDRTVVLYDVERRDGSEVGLALGFDPRRSKAEPFTPPPQARLRRSAWGIERLSHSDAGTAAHVKRTLENGPFYARSVIGSTLLGEPAAAMHESLDLDRFTAPWVQAMLPFRMPRRAL